MDRKLGVTIKMFGRDYDLAYGRQPSGVNWLMAVNKETGAVLPLTSIYGMSMSANRIDVLDSDAIVPTLEAAGIIRRAGPSQMFLGFKLCRCEIIHAGLAEELAELRAKNIETGHERDGQSR